MQTERITYKNMVQDSDTDKLALSTMTVAYL